MLTHPAFSQIKDLQFKRLFVDDGLHEKYATCLLQYNIGYIWFGTDSRLQCDEGYKIEIYNLNTRYQKGNFSRSISSVPVEPHVEVRSIKLNIKLEIRANDYGINIQKVLDEIYQPFLVTKTAGQGTGLGLSLSHDIVEASVGELKVRSKDDEGAEFIIQLPILSDPTTPKNSINTGSD